MYLTNKHLLLGASIIYCFYSMPGYLRKQSSSSANVVSSTDRKSTRATCWLEKARAVPPLTSPTVSNLLTEYCSQKLLTVECTAQKAVT